MLAILRYFEHSRDMRNIAKKKVIHTNTKSTYKSNSLCTTAPFPSEKNLRDLWSCTQAKKIIANRARQSILIFQILYLIHIIALVTARRRNLEDFSNDGTEDSSRGQQVEYRHSDDSWQQKLASLPDFGVLEEDAAWIEGYSLVNIGYSLDWIQVRSVIATTGSVMRHTTTNQRRRFAR